MSDRATYTEYMVLNGDMLTHIGVLVDPVFLTEPLVRARNSSAPSGSSSADLAVGLRAGGRNRDADRRRRAGLPTG